jgi:hypothetical protein
MLVQFREASQPTPEEQVMRAIRDATLRDGVPPANAPPEAYWIPGGPTLSVEAQVAQKYGELVPCTLPVNAELTPVLDEVTGQVRLVRPGRGDERRMALAILSRRAVLWSEPRWQLAEERSDETCPNGRILVAAEVFGNRSHTAAGN